jgi:hypothetical protein
VAFESCGRWALRQAWPVRKSATVGYELSDTCHSPRLPISCERWAGFQRSVIAYSDVVHNLAVADTSNLGGASAPGPLALCSSAVRARA